MEEGNAVGRQHALAAPALYLAGRLARASPCAYSEMPYKHHYHLPAAAIQVQGIALNVHSVCGQQQ